MASTGSKKKPKRKSTVIIKRTSPEKTKPTSKKANNK
jgi:hypothetical protein